MTWTPERTEDLCRRCDECHDDLVGGVCPACQDRRELAAAADSYGHWAERAAVRYTAEQAHTVRARLLRPKPPRRPGKPRLVWCPPHMRGAYFALLRKKLRATEARELIERDMARGRTA